MTEQSLTVEAFIALLDTHGADLAAWPEDRRSAAEALLADSAEAVSAFAEARANPAFVAPEPGQRVLIAKYGGVVLTGEDGADYRIMNDEDIVGMISEGS